MAVLITSAAPATATAEVPLPAGLIDFVNARIVAPPPASPPLAPARPSVPEVTSVGEVAKRWGLDRKTVYDAAARGELPARRVGRRWIISHAALEAWLVGGAP